MKLCLSAAMDDAHRARVLQTVPACEIVRIEPDGRLSGDPEGIEAFFFSLELALQPEALAAAANVLKAPGLRWLQSPGAGVDHPVFAGLLARGVRVTNAAGLHAEPIAQYVFAYVLHWERNVQRHLAQQQAREWQVIVSEDLTAKTLGIVGLGGIGTAAARVARAFGMRVVATRRTRAEDPNVDLLLPPQRLHELLGAAHYVVLCLPFTAETRGLIGEAELRAMRADAVLVNVARGGVVEEPALVAALRERRIRGATLDVASQEPLPPESELWTLDNCVVTPHDAGYSPRANERLAELFFDNLARYAAGEPLRNQIDESDLA